MKTDKISLKWKLFAYIVLFAVVIILIFSLFQIFLLDGFYRRTKTKDINSLTNNIVSVIDDSLSNNNNFNVENSNLKEKLTSLSNDEEGSIYIFKKNNSSIDLIFESSKGGSYQLITTSIITNEIWEKAIKVKNDFFYVIFTENPDPMFQTMVTEDSNAQEKDYLICGKFFEDSEYEYMVIVDSRLTPVGPAVSAMKTQITYISIIVVILAIVVALLLSRSISKPIIAMNNTAKKMAKGNLDVIFEGKGYSEITDLNNTLNYTVEELKKTENLQRELLANVSHDLRTPLTLISGYAEMMKDIPEEKTEENVQIIIDETKRLSLLVNDLLSLSRIKARTDPLNLVEFDISELLDQIVKRQNKLIENSHIQINLQQDEKNIVVKADIRKIEQVIYNFINNAINYSGESKKVDVIQEFQDDKVIIKVKDYGIGIKKEHLDFIWQRYYRVDKGLQRSSQGTGLGLSIIKEILEYHGFNYGVESEVGQGSTFYFEIPLEKNK